MDQKRDGLVDYIKGMLMWGVVWGHAITALKGGVVTQPTLIHIFFRTYDMPFFMLISGYFLGRSLLRQGCGKLLLNRATMILLPAVLWNLLVLNRHFTSYYFLWAVFVCSAICILAHWLETLLHARRLYLEFGLELASLLVLHLVYVPWNVFYLFPFFVFGRYLPDLQFRLKHFLPALLLFVVMLFCWKGVYSPWTLGHDAWKDSWTNLLVYVYRFALGVLGCFVMARVFRWMYGRDAWLRPLMETCGRQTLAIYIMQSILIERCLGEVVAHLYGWLQLTALPAFVVVLLGYVLAPLVALLTLWLLSRVASWCSSHPYTRRLFGFKVA